MADKKISELITFPNDAVQTSDIFYVLGSGIAAENRNATNYKISFKDLTRDIVDDIGGGSKILDSDDNSIYFGGLTPDDIRDVQIQVGGETAITIDDSLDVFMSKSLEVADDLIVGDDLHVRRDTFIGRDLWVTGNLFVSGSTTQIDTVELIIEDNNVQLGRSTDYTPTVDTAHLGGITLVAGDLGPQFPDDGNDYTVNRPSPFCDDATYDDIAQPLSYNQMYAYNVNTCDRIIVDKDSGLIKKEIYWDKNTDSWNFNIDGRFHEDLLITGDVAIGGSLTISGDRGMTISNNLYVEGQAFIDDALTVSGDAYFQANTHVSGNSHISGNLNVTGNTFIASELTVTGDVDFKDDLNVRDTITVFGDSFLRQNVNITNNTEIGNNLTVKSSGFIEDDALVGDDLYVSGISYLNEGLYVSGDSHLENNLHVSGSGYFKNDITVSGNANFSGYAAFDAIPQPDDTDNLLYRWEDNDHLYWGDVPLSKPFVGSNPLLDGYLGLVPTPHKDDDIYFLSASGDWKELTRAGTNNVLTPTVNDLNATVTTFATNLSSSVDDFYKYDTCVITVPDGGGTNTEYSVEIVAYDGTTKAITLKTALPTAPANGTSLQIINTNYGTVRIGNENSDNFGGLIIDDEGFLRMKNYVDAPIEASFYISDYRLKENIQPISDPLYKLDKIHGFNFTWNDLNDSKIQGSKDVGVIAQDINAVLPEATKMNDDGYMEVAYHKIIPLLIESVKDLSIQNKKLEDRVKSLESKS